MTQPANKTGSDMPITPAMEAMEDIAGLELMHDEKICDTIRQALAMLDLIQRGEAKVLRREPTREMLAPIYGDVYEDGKYYWDCEDNVLQAAQEEWAMGWDAAPPYPATAAIEQHEAKE